MKKYILGTLFFLLLSSYIGFAQKIDLVFVKGGTFFMGNNDGDTDEQPAHTVTINSYYIGKYEVTVKQYRAFCNATGKEFPTAPTNEFGWYDNHPDVGVWKWRDNHPMVKVSWYDANDYCKWLSKKTGKKYRLPTEAEWEYAARGGRRSRKYIYSGSNDIDLVAWYDETTEETGTKRVGTKKANELGIYDMSGNAWEWCSDFYHHKYYQNSPKDNPKGMASGRFKVIRGGSWYYISVMATSTVRDGPKPTFSNYNYGFRVVRQP